MNTKSKNEISKITGLNYRTVCKYADKTDWNDKKMFQVVSECYERKSLIITSNFEFSGWNAVLGDNRLTAALIDRLVYHSHIVIFSGESYRIQQLMQRQKSLGKK